MTNNFSILVAEDDMLVRQNIVKLLKLFFKIVYEANDGLEAFDIYKDKKPDILLTDNIMPNLNGIDLIKKIRVNDNNIKIIMLSAHSELEQLLDAVKLNLTEYIIKPIIYNKFIELLNSTISELEDKNKIYLVDDYIWDKSKNLLIKHNNILKLTKTESRFFEIIGLHSETIVDIDILANYIWDDKILKNHANSIRNLVNKLNRRVKVRLIESVYGNGYKLVKK